MARKWPTRLRRKLVSADGVDARAKAEEDERNQWITEARSMIRHAKLPIAEVAEKSLKPESIWAGIPQGLRARTLRRRVRDWQKAARFFTRSSGTPWPRDVASLLHYMQVLENGEVPLSAMQNMMFACSFMEKAGGVDKTAHV